ncbi:MAG: carboxymuconolactone decarboxylase family protein [Pseudomonadota bacterium]
MPRLPQLARHEAPAAARPLLDRVRARTCSMPNGVKVLSNSPAMLEGYLSLSNGLAKGHFSAREGTAIALAIAGRNACEYCATLHAATAKRLEIEPHEITGNLNGRSADRRIGAALRLACAILETRGRVRDDLLDDVRRAGLSDAEMVEIVGHVALSVLTNYANHLAGTEIDFPSLEALMCEESL